MKSARKRRYSCHCVKTSLLWFKDWYFNGIDKMNENMLNLMNELVEITKKHANNEDVKAHANLESENKLRMQIIISGKNELDITLNSLQHAV